MKRIAIIGGGISGLATAYYLQQINLDFEIRIFEASDHAGGILETSCTADALMEHGPDAFISEKPWALELCRELGLESEIIPTRAENRRSFILCGKNLKAIPAGFYLTAPKTFSAWWNLPGMSFAGKLRMLGDLFLPAKKDNADESVADFICRRFGRETLEKLAQPMIAGIYTAAPDQLSLMATFPQFREMEKKHGSVIRGLAKKKSAAQASGPRYSLFLSLRGGMADIIRALEQKLKGKIECFAPVQKITHNGSEWEVHIDQDVYEADAVCLAIPAHAAARLTDENLAQKLRLIHFESVATINFLFDKKDIRHPLDGFGFVVPAAEKRNLIGCSFSHQKFEGRILDSNHVLLRAFVGGAYGRDIFNKPDEAMIAAVLDDLKDILGVLAAPRKTLLHRYPQGMPQYEVGHLERVRDIFETAADEKGLFLTGNSYYGIGIPDCVRHAKETAEKIAQLLQSRASGLGPLA